MKSNVITINSIQFAKLMVWYKEKGLLIDSNLLTETDTYCVARVITSCGFKKQNRLYKVVA
ncbi:MAG: hypothetical protein ACRC2K_13380 [Clostridium sp.]